MKSTTNKIREIRKAKGLSQQQLADLVGTSNQQISFLENGERQLNLDWIERLSKVLGASVSEIIGEKEFTAQRISQTEIHPVTIPVASSTQATPRDFPLMGYAQAVDADSIPTALEKRPIKLLERPPQFFGVDDGFAVIVAGAAMSPRFENKDLLYINPRLMAAVDDDVLIEMNDGGIALRRIMAIDANGVTLRQYQPKKDTKFLKTQYRRLMRVVMVARE